ncbi:hypothetical protein QZM46_07585 [Burkholderia vietnamiensis]|uniref:Uncharacterized protein n=1 Tax=Burkholderia vietnamiensis TaxID=60552 RepID=A0AAW7T914_BURVI|nr:hypothetical protein [Burkholderia vietnamiensis]MBH9645756.1 hypothetical protein [Burkholderia vietnamiensis]MBR8008237.1 hypothetical protein [Burkholderia vietnamiensis]MDN7551211.1 hypothetical protein [Burkholderia vietnamiensis]MDN7798518.1 hypothetical protein [Burkholderia vietnamiensis]MDN8044663.1 hypothetical protein [Burkholderia vietnamiensis]
MKVVAPPVRLSPGELELIESIIEHIYPDPTAGSTLPIESSEMRAAKSLERKGVVVIGEEGDQPRMTFTTFGASVYKRCLGDRTPW